MAYIGTTFGATQPRKPTHDIWVDLLFQDSWVSVSYVEVMQYSTLVDDGMSQLVSATEYQAQHDHRTPPQMVTADAFWQRMTPHEWKQIVQHGHNGSLVYVTTLGTYRRYRFGTTPYISYSLVRLTKLPRIFQDPSHVPGNPYLPTFQFMYSLVHPTIDYPCSATKQPLTAEHVQLLFPDIVLRPVDRAYGGYAVAPMLVQLFYDDVEEVPYYSRATLHPHVSQDLAKLKAFRTAVWSQSHNRLANPYSLSEYGCVGIGTPPWPTRMDRFQPTIIDCGLHPSHQRAAHLALLSATPTPRGGTPPTITTTNQRQTYWRNVIEVEVT